MSPTKEPTTRTQRSIRTQRRRPEESRFATISQLVEDGIERWEIWVPGDALPAGAMRSGQWMPAAYLLRPGYSSGGETWLGQAPSGLALVVRPATDPYEPGGSTIR